MKFFRKNLCSLSEAFLREALLKKETCFLFYKFYKQPLTHPPLPPPSFYKVMLQIFLKFCQKVQKRKIWQKIYWENVHIWHKMLWQIWPQNLYKFYKKAKIFLKEGFFIIYSEEENRSLFSSVNNLRLYQLLCLWSLSNNRLTQPLIILRSSVEGTRYVLIF